MDKDQINIPGHDQDRDSMQAGTPGQSDSSSGQHTRVENAHAAGVGAMGRNDEKLPSDEEGAEEPIGGQAY